jgi:chromosome segregation ATPase
MSIHLLEEQILKVSKLTEQQRETVRQAAVCAKNLEARLAEEQKRASQLEEQREAFRTEAVQAAKQGAARLKNVEARLAEEQKRSSQLEEQKEALRAGLAEEQKQSAQLMRRIAELEPLAASAEKFGQALNDILRSGNKA